MFRTRHVGNPVVRDIGDGVARLSPDLQAVVDELWREAQAEAHGALFNGTLFTMTDVAGGEIRGHFAEYKSLIAQRLRPSLSSQLKIRPVAVMGVLRCEDGIVFGRRSTEVTEDRDLWEMVPSGGLTVANRSADGSVDFQGQILTELEEEIGIGRGHVQTVRPLCVVENTDNGVLDIVVELSTNNSARFILDAFRAVPHGEYIEIEIVPPARISEFLAVQARSIASLSRYLLEHPPFSSPSL